MKYAAARTHTQQQQRQRQRQPQQALHYTVQYSVHTTLCTAHTDTHISPFKHDCISILNTHAKHNLAFNFDKNV